MARPASKISEVRKSLDHWVDQRYDRELDSFTAHRLIGEIEKATDQSDPRRYDSLAIINTVTWQWEKAVELHKVAIGLSGNDEICWLNLVTSASTVSYAGDDIASLIDEGYERFFKNNNLFRIEYATYLGDTGRFDQLRSIVGSMDAEDVRGLGDAYLSNYYALVEELDMLDQSIVDESVFSEYRKIISDVCFDNQVFTKCQDVFFDDDRTLIIRVSVGCDPVSDLLSSLSEQVKERLFNKFEDGEWIGQVSSFFKGISNVNELDRTA